LGKATRAFTFLAVLGVITLAISLYFYSFYEIFKVAKTIVNGKPKEGEVILQALKAIDLVLVSIIFFIIGLGLFELFIKPIDNLPRWLQVRNLDHLKSMLIKVIVLVMGVSFTGRIVTWDGETDLLGYGIGIGVVTLALSYFLKVKSGKEEEEEKEKQ
jgi:uncharacterized membrane protein YqhA